MFNPAIGVEAAASFRAAAAADDPLDQVSSFEDFFAAGCTAGAVAPLPRDAAEGRALPVPIERVAALRERLTRLGYAVGKTPPDRTGLWDAALAAALAAFQREAGLDAHGALDVTTWDALQELFNFESPLRAPRWFDESAAPRPALVRAAQLRLSVLGFGDAPAPGAPPPALPGEALRAFEGAAADLGVISPAAGPLVEQPAASRVAALFDHERIVGRLAAVDGAAVVGLPRARREAAETLLVCAAKIELWLFGYEVRPDGDPELGRRARHGRPGAPPPVRRFDETRTAGEMRRFLEDIEPAAARVPLPRLASELPRLFQQTLVLRARGEGAGQPAQSREIVAALAPQMEREPALLARLLARAASLVSRLFDGVRRVFAWVGRLLRTAASRVFEQAANLWRAVYHFSGLVAFRLRQAIDAFARGVHFLFSPVQESDPRGEAVYGRRADFDVALALRADGEGLATLALARRLEGGARRFAIACRIVALASGAARRFILRPALGPLGFLSLLLGLAEVYSEVREIGAQLAALDET